MAGQFSELYAKFDKLPEAKRRELDDVLKFMETARMPTEQGARNRGILQQKPLDPNNVRLMGAYAAYRYKLNHQPMDEGKRAIAKASGVPDEEIAAQDSPEKWEAEQFNRFQPLMDLVRPPEMPAEVITGNVPKKKKIVKPKVMPATKPTTGAGGNKPEEEVAPQAPAYAPPPAAPAPREIDPVERAVLKLQQQRAQEAAMVGASTDAATQQPALIAAPPSVMPPPMPIGQLNEDQLPLAVRLGGQYA